MTWTSFFSAASVAQANRGAAQIAALGDLMLVGEWEEVVAAGRERDAYGPLQPFLSGSVVLANLETTVATGTLIPKEPRVVASADTIRRSLSALGVDLVNLANNHAFDAYLQGFHETKRLLEAAAIRSFGAGEDLQEAARACRLEVNQIRLGFLGYVAPDTRPSHLADARHYGANPLDVEKAGNEVAELAAGVDHVIVSLHWGIEFCNLPSPAQIHIARELVDRGASAVIGHHAHVIQGIEVYRDAVIAYGIGNLTTSGFYISSRLARRQTARTRSSVVLRLGFDKERLRSAEVLPVRSTNGQLLVGDSKAEAYLDSSNRLLARGVSETGWRIRRLFEDVLLRTLRKLHPAVVLSLRPHHAVRLLQNLSRSLRGRGPA